MSESSDFRSGDNRCNECGTTKTVMNTYMSGMGYRCPKGCDASDVERILYKMRAVILAARNLQTTVTSKLPQKSIDRLTKKRQQRLFRALDELDKH